MMHRGKKPPLLEQWRLKALLMPKYLPLKWWHYYTQNISQRKRGVDI
ncbi:MAG: hypothetical protein FWH22_11335 [Fibromonadales bacterium]|nr:hypothetical protein [Fibromonadales bacterium]